MRGEWALHSFCLFFILYVIFAPVPFFALLKIQLSLREFVSISKDSHPYYKLWRVFSEWCTESDIGKRGEVTLAKARAIYEQRKLQAVKIPEGGKSAEERAPGFASVGDIFEVDLVGPNLVGLHDELKET